MRKTGSQARFFDPVAISTPTKAKKTLSKPRTLPEKIKKKFSSLLKPNRTTSSCSQRQDENVFLFLKNKINKTKKQNQSFENFKIIKKKTNTKKRKKF